MKKGSILMCMQRFNIFRSIVPLALFLMLCTKAFAVTSSDVVIDSPTLHSLGFYVPYSGQQVSVEYRAQGTVAYKQALGMLKIRTGQFGGSILGLQSGTAYDVKMTFDDGTVLNIPASTRSEPLQDPANPNLIVVSNNSALSTALNNAKAGDVIFIQNGTYSGPYVIRNSGTRDNPIIIRGESVGGVVIQSAERIVTNEADYSNVCSQGGSNLRIEGSHVYVEGLTLRGATWGIIIETNSVPTMEGIVVRNTKIENVICGIRANDNTHRNHNICGNILQGKFINEDTGRKTWNVEGIKILGQGHDICNNTLSGFGDTIDIPGDGSASNRAIDIYGNDILFGGDDGLELDGGQRNIRAFGNRIANSGTGISVQPGGGGPFYIHRNIIYNVGLAYTDFGQVHEPRLPFKLKNGASGMYIFHNTAVRPGDAWHQGESVENSKIFNNLILGTTGGATFNYTSNTQVDYNGFNRNNPYGSNGVRLINPIFSPADPILSSNATDWRPYYTPPALSLAAQSAAVDNGIVLPNINDNYSGSAPDIGALELNQPLPNYGVLSNDATPPGMVTGVMATGLSESVVEINWSAALDAESGVSAYAIYRGGIRVATANTTSYQDTGLNENTTYNYAVAAINGAGLEGPRSTVTSGSTLADFVPPTLMQASAASATQINLSFSEAVTAASAEQASNYTIDGGILVNSASLQADGKSVRLTTSTLSQGVLYRLTAFNIYDRASSPNIIQSGNAIDFQYVGTSAVSNTQPSNYVWGIIDAGSQVYVDRSFTYTNVPTAYRGLSYLKTANDDKFSSGGSFITFSVDTNTTVYVGYDTRISTIPSWLQGWIDTGNVLGTNDATLKIYQKDFNTGTVALGGNEAGNSMYVVLTTASAGGNGNNNGGTGNGNGSGNSAPPAGASLGGGGSGSLDVYLLTLLLFAVAYRSVRSAWRKSTLKISRQ